MSKPITYKSSGVNYDLLDKLKRMAQIAGKETFKNITDFVIEIEENAQGESAFVINLANQNLALAFVQEGLGTKNLVADAMFSVTGKTYYQFIAQDTVAMIINDLITVGAKPISVSAYWAIGDEKWLKNENRLKDLVEGWKNACDMAGTAWTGGETPILSGVINPETIDLAGSAFGIINPKSRLTLGEKLQTGDTIIFFQSSGIHANGLSLARKLAEKVDYRTKISDGRMFGEALLDPTIIYAKLIQDLLTKDIDIHYMVNITGHGWRKLMRNKKEFTYRIKEIPSVPAVLQFIKEKAELSDEEAYGNLNMGAGFAIFVSQNQVEDVFAVVEDYNKIMSPKIKILNAGKVEKGKKQVIIEPINVTFSSETLNLRA